MFGCVYMYKYHACKLTSVCIPYMYAYLYEYTSNTCHASHRKLHMYACRHTSMNTRMLCIRYVQPIPLAVTFPKAQSSKLERLFCHVSVKRDVRALISEL